MKLNLSTLSKTWIFDVDGTLVHHNGHLTSEGDRLLPGVKDFFDSLPETDVVILLTARSEEQRKDLLHFLENNGIRFNYLLTGMPVGERILVNDTKPSGLLTAFSVNVVRDKGIFLDIDLDSSL